jgi:class 3 adenylate cyclase
MPGNEHEGLPDVPSGTVTFLFTDIEGSTKLLEQLREGYVAVLADQRDLLRAAFAHCNGHEIDTQGDAFFVAFPRALDALNCVIEGQQAVAQHAWPAGVQVRVRMGLHTGEPILARTGYVGMDVHRAARIASAGYGGQVLLSQTTRDLIVQDLPAGAALRALGEHKLKDIRFPQTLYQLDIVGQPSDFPPLKTMSSGEEPPAPGEPPFKGLQYYDEADADWFFGRDGVTQQLAVRACAARFLAVIGASGSGKSSLVRAGLVPALKRSGPASACPEVRWQIFVITPTRAACTCTSTNAYNWIGAAPAPPARNGCCWWWTNLKSCSRCAATRTSGAPSWTTCWQRRAPTRAGRALP